MIRVYCDGSIRDGNPGGWAVGGWLAKSESGEVIMRGCIDMERRPTNTNNVAEYAAVWAALYQLALVHPGAKLLVHSDSQLIVKQLRGEYQCAHPALRQLRGLVQRRAQAFESVEYRWIPREQNTEADAQSRALYPDSPKNR